MQIYLKKKSKKFVNDELESDSSDKPKYSVDSDIQSARRLTDESINQYKVVGAYPKEKKL